jgi:cation transport regulator ChaC
MWIFGYGSLIWRPDLDFVEHRDGFVRGWERKFYQGSTDHRGVPGAPGRVATLVRAPQSHVWGRAYRVSPAEREDILEQLDHREKGGYERHQVDVVVPSGEDVYEALVYVATPENPEWLGAATPAEIARQILSSHGPSGPNPEYLLELAESLRRIKGADDPHVFAIERALLELRRVEYE